MNMYFKLTSGDVVCFYVDENGGGGGGGGGNNDIESTT